MALDLGEARIGLALSDSGGVLASPYSTIERSGQEDEDRSRIAEAVRESGAELVVVGHPLLLSGKAGPAARAAEAEAEALSRELAVPVELFDERLTTTEATRRRRERAVSGSGRRRRAGREGIDAEAAAVLLEAYLSSRRSAP